MRSRNIKPNFFTDSDLLECDPLARILFAGLWCYADREGRLKDSVKQLKIALLPCDECDVENLLEQLAGCGRIARYEVAREKYIQIKNFLIHQKPHKKEQPSIIPCLPKSGKPGKGTGKPRPRYGQDQTQAVACPASSLIPSSLIPDSLIPHPVTGANAPFAREPTEDFSEFWEIYPKKRAGSREKALSAYLKATNRSTIEEIYEGVRAYADSDEVARGYAKGAAAWLNDDRWRNDYTAPRQTSNLSNALAGLAAAADSFADKQRGNGLEPTGSAEEISELPQRTYGGT